MQIHCGFGEISLTKWVFDLIHFPIECRQAPRSPLLPSPALQKKFIHEMAILFCFISFKASGPSRPTPPSPQFKYIFQYPNWDLIWFWSIEIGRAPTSPASSELPKRLHSTNEYLIRLQPIESGRAPTPQIFKRDWHLIWFLAIEISGTAVLDCICRTKWESSLRWRDSRYPPRMSWGEDSTTDFVPLSIIWSSKKFRDA